MNKLLGCYKVREEKTNVKGPSLQQMHYCRWLPLGEHNTSLRAEVWEKASKSL